MVPPSRKSPTSSQDGLVDEVDSRRRRRHVRMANRTIPRPVLNRHNTRQLYKIMHRSVARLPFSNNSQYYTDRFGVVNFADICANEWQSMVAEAIQYQKYRPVGYSITFRKLPCYGFYATEANPPALAGNPIRVNWRMRTANTTNNNLSLNLPVSTICGWDGIRHCQGNMEVTIHGGVVRRFKVPASMKSGHYAIVQDPIAQPTTDLDTYFRNWYAKDVADESWNEADMFVSAEIDNPRTMGGPSPVPQLRLYCAPEFEVIYNIYFEFIGYQF